MPCDNIVTQNDVTSVVSCSVESTLVVHESSVSVVESSAGNSVIESSVSETHVLTSGTVVNIGGGSSGNSFFPSGW